MAAERGAHEGRTRAVRVMFETRNGSRSCWSTGLLAPSFVPPPEIRRLRMLTRYRVQLMGDRRRDIVRLELMLDGRCSFGPRSGDQRRCRSPRS